MYLSKKKIKLNHTYYTFYMELAKNSNSIKNTTGVFKVKLISIDELGYGKWEIEEANFSNDIIAYNIKNRLNGVIPDNAIECLFYTSKNNAIIAYNKQIDKFIFIKDTEKQIKLKLKLKII